MPYKITTGKDGKPEVVVTGFDPAKAKNPVQPAAAKGEAQVMGADVGALGENLSSLGRTAVKGVRDLAQSVLGNLPADTGGRLSPETAAMMPEPVRKALRSITGPATPRMPGAPDAPILGVFPPLPKVQTKGPTVNVNLPVLGKQSFKVEDVGAGLIQAGVGWFLASKGLGRVAPLAMRAPGAAAVARAAAPVTQAAKTAVAFGKGAPGAAGIATKVAAKTGEIVLKGAPAGAIVDYAAFDPSESGQLLDGATKWIDKLPDPLRDAAHNLVLSAPGDTAADARWKGAVGGFMVLGPAAAGVIEGLGYSARAIRRVHQARVANRPPEPPTGGTPAAAAAPEAPAAAQTVDVTAAPVAPPKAPPKGPAPGAPKAPARAVGIAQQYQEMRPRQPLWEKTEVQTQGAMGLPVAQAPQSPRTLPAEAYYPRLNYSDINPSASPTLNASGKRYAKALAGQDQAAVEATQQAIQSSFKDAATKLGIEPGPNAGSQSWSMWDIGKQLYMSANPAKSSKAYALGNPLVDVQVQADIVDRMLGFELTQGVDPQGKRLPSWRLTEIGRKARKGAGVELSLQPAQGALAPPTSAIQEAEAELRTAIDAVDTSIAKAASTVPDEMGPVSAAERGNVMPSYSQVREEEVANIGTDPVRFQFKAAGIGKTGVTGSLANETVFNRQWGGWVSVWRDPQTNQLFVVNGHNRLDLARRAGTKNILIWEIDAATAEEARAIGAMENIAQGQGTPWDAAKIMRDMGINAEEMVRRNIDVTKGVAEKGVALSRLPQDVFEQGVTGKLTLDKAVALGSEKLDDVVVRDVAAAATKNGWGPEKILQAMQEAKFAQTSGPSGGGVLPGFESMFTTSNFGTMLDVRTEAFKALREEMIALTSLAMKGRTGIIESAGNVVDVAGSQAAKGQAQVAVDVFNRVTGYTGPVRDLLNEMAGQVGGKRTAKAVVTENLGRLKAAIEDEMKGPRLPLEQAAPAPSVPSAGTLAPVAPAAAVTPAPRTAVQPMGNVAAAAVEPPAPVRPPAEPTINIPESASRRANPNTPARTESAAESLFSWTSSPLPGAKPVFRNFDEALAAVRAKDRILDIDAVPGLDMDAARNDKALGKVTPATQAVANAYEQFYKGGGRAELTSEAVRRIMPDELPDTRGQGQFFHGSSASIKELKAESDVPGITPKSGTLEIIYQTATTKGKNIYGQGFYATDDLTTASAYQKKGTGTTPVVYQIKEKNPNLRFYDLDQQIGRDAVDDLFAEAPGMAREQVYSAVDDALSGAQYQSLGQALDLIRNTNGAFKSQDVFDAIKKYLASQGYGGFTHQGGSLAGQGKRLHQVKIYWNPETQLELKRYEAPAAPTAELTSEAVRRIMPDELPDALRADPDLIEATKKLMVDTVRRIAGDNIAITFEDGIVLKQGSKAHGTEGKIVRIGGGYSYEGIGDPIDEAIAFHEMGLLAKEGQSAVDYTKDKLEVAAHEAFHAAQLRYMSSAQLKVLNTAFAKLKLYFAAKNRQARARGAKPRPIETSTQAYESFDQAAQAGVSPGAVILGMSPDDVKFFTTVDPKNPLLASMGASDRAILSGAKTILAGVKLVDDLFDRMEKLYNAMRGRGWTSIRSIFEEAASGKLKETPGMAHAKSDLSWNDAREWAQRVKMLDRLGAPGFRSEIEFAKGEGMLSERATLANEQPVEPQGPRPVDPPPGPENSDDWVRNFAREWGENYYRLLSGEVTTEDLMANNFQKVQSPSGGTVYAVATEDLVSGYDAMTKVLPSRQVQSGFGLFSAEETATFVQRWFNRHGADQELVTNGLMPLIRGFNEYQVGDLNRAMALADKKQVEASMEAAMWLNSASVDGVNQSERLARLITAAESARVVHTAVMKVTRPWGQLGLEMQMRRDYDIPPATGAPAAPTPAPVLPPELQAIDVGEEIIRGLEDESTRPIEESFSDELREAATGGEITPRAQAEADAIAQTLVDTGADPTIRTKTWGNFEALRDSGQNGANPLLMLRTNNLISSGVTANVNFQNGLLNLIRLPLTQTTGALAQGEIKRAMYSMMAFQQYWMNLSNAFRIAGHAFKAGRSLMNMDANTLDFMDRIAAKDAQGELLQGPDAMTGWTINTVDMSEEMARKPLGMAINGLWQVLGTGASRVSITIDTFNSTLAGYAYEHVRHLPRGMEQAVERGMVEFSPEAWRFAQQYAETRTQATMRDAAINGKNLADVAMESPHAKNFMNAINFTDDVWAEMQPRTLAEGIEAGQSQGLKGNELQDFAKKYVEEGQLNHRLANYALNGRFAFGRFGSLPGQTMATLSEAKFIGPVFKFLQPFQRVPSNIIKSAMRGTPAAVFVDTFWRDINSADPFTRDRAIGEIAVGSGALALVALGTTMGHLRFNGGGPVADPVAMRKWSDIEGRMPYSVQYWDEAAGKWSAATSMQALEPFATIFGAIGDYNDLANSISADQRNRLGGSLIMTLARMTASGVLSKSYFQGINEIYEAAFNPSKVLVGPGQRDPLARFLQRIAASMVPYSSALRAARREVDPVARTVDPSDAGGLMGFWEETLGEICNAVPGYSEGLPARRDFINGQPILTPGILGGEMIPADMPWIQGAMQLAPWSAYRQVRKSLGPVHEEMALLSGTGTSFMGPSATDFGANARLTPSELETYVETFANVKDQYGRNFELAVTQLIESDQYRSWPLVAPDPRDVSLRAAAIQAEIQVFKNLAKEQFKAYTPKGQAIAAEEAAAKGRQLEANYIRQYGMDNSPQPAQTGGSWSPTPGNR